MERAKEGREGKVDERKGRADEGRTGGKGQKPSKPPPSPSTANGAHTQGDGEHRRRRRRRRHHWRCHCAASNPPPAARTPQRVPPPTKHPGKRYNPPPNRTPPPHNGGNHHERQRRRRRRRPHRHCAPTTVALGVPPPNITPMPGKHPPSPVSPNHEGDRASSPLTRHRPTPFLLTGPITTIASHDDQRGSIDPLVGDARVKEEIGEEGKRGRRRRETEGWRMEEGETEDWMQGHGQQLNPEPICGGCSSPPDDGNIAVVIVVSLRSYPLALLPPAGPVESSSPRKRPNPYDAHSRTARF